MDSKAEKISGAKSDRKQLSRLIAHLGDGDVLAVTRLDRLARSTRDLLNLLVPSPTREPDSNHCGIPGPKLTRHQRQEAIARRESGESLVDMRSLLTNALGALVASEDAVRKEVEGPRAEWLLAWARARPAELEHSRRVRFCVQRSV